MDKNMMQPNADMNNHFNEADMIQPQVDINRPPLRKEDMLQPEIDKKGIKMAICRSNVITKTLKNISLEPCYVCIYYLKMQVLLLEKIFG